MTNAPTRATNVVMLSNNSGDQIVPAAAGRPESRHQGRHLGLADSVGEGRERLRGAGRLRLRPARSWPTWRCILGEDGGKFAILSASPDAANQNAWIAAMKKALSGSEVRQTRAARHVYGNDQSEKSYDQALPSSTSTRTWS